MPVRTCIDCGTPCTGSRCPQHQAQRTNTKHAAYNHPDYQTMKRWLDITWQPCHWGCGRRATTVEHIIPIINGGAIDRTNLAGACAPCNYGRGGQIPDT